MSTWIKNSEQLPPDNTLVLAAVELIDDSVILIQIKHSRGGRFGIHPLLRDSALAVGYWMPALEPPDGVRKTLWSSP